MPKSEKTRKSMRRLEKREFSAFELSKDELRQLSAAAIIGAIIFAYDWVNPLNIISYIHVSLVTVIIIFLARTFAQKFVARKFGCFAVFRIWLTGIVFGLLLMVIGIRFAALGAVFVYPFAFGRWGHKTRYLTVSEYGLVASVAPLLNIIFAVALRLMPGYNTLVAGLPSHVRPDMINAWFALFTLLPVKPLEGSQILTWKPWVWLTMSIATALLFFV